MVQGRFELVRLGGLTIGRAIYQPGWRWSSHVGPAVGATHCTVEHVGLVVAGTATAAFDDGRVIELRAGELFHIPAVPHDSWVMPRQRTIAVAVSLVALTLLVLVPVLSWREHRRFNPGAFLLLVLVAGPLLAARREGTN